MKSLLHLIILTSLLACGQDENPERLEFSEENSIHDTTIQVEQLINKLDTLYGKPNSSQAQFGELLAFEDTLRTIYEQIDAASYGLDFEPFRFGMIGYYSLRQDKRLNDKELLSIIDFTKSSCTKRFYTIDLKSKKILFNTLVSHGRNTGGDKASKFSDKPQSYQSSLGFYITGNSYVGSKGYSMRLHGDEIGYNANMHKRAIVMHDASYVSESWIKKYGRIGRSLGCPALPKGISKEVIKVIKNKTVIFAYHKNEQYLKASKYLNVHQLMERFKNQ